MFKRNLDIGPQLTPWLVPASKIPSCPAHPKTEVLQVPQQTIAGVSFHKYYVFTISPDSLLFYNKSDKKVLHTPFAAFTTQHYDTIVNLIGEEMEIVFRPGFNKRNSLDPVPSYKNVKRVWFR
jgi:hypothetical protein